MTSDPAPSAEPRPLHVLSFTLTRADALAFETLPREIQGWRLALLIVWIGLAGAAVSLLPPDWVSEENGWLFWAWMAGLGLIQYGLAVFAMTLLAHRRAALRLPGPAAVELHDHVDHLEWRENGRPSYVAPETIAQVITTPRHLFVRVEGQALIVPVRAFEDADEMMAYAAALERRIGD